MRGERKRHPQRLPRRVTDRIEDAVAWLLTTVGLLVVVLAVTTGARLYGEGMHRLDVEYHDRTQVQAVLLEPAPAGVALGDMGRRAAAIPVPVPARYTAPDGTAGQADARVQGPLPAGAAVPVWVDRAGDISTALGSRVEVVESAATGGAGVLIVGASVLGGLWAGVRGSTQRAVMARWEREWVQVEPRWSGRVPP
jgi:hypothetical protein